MQPGHGATAHILPATGEESRVEVFIEPQGDASRVALRQSTWVEGLGWCAQKTIRLDAAQLEDLHRALTAARHRLARESAEQAAATAPASVIQFPTLL